MHRPDDEAAARDHAARLRASDRATPVDRLRRSCAARAGAGSRCRMSLRDLGNSRRGAGARIRRSRVRRRRACPGTSARRRSSDSARAAARADLESWGRLFATRAISAAGRAWMPCACATTTASLTTGASCRRVATDARGAAISSSSNSTSPAASRRSRWARTDPEALAIRDDDGRDETAGPARQQLQVEAQQHIAGAHAIALAHQRRRIPRRPAPRCRCRRAPGFPRRRSARSAMAWRAAAIEITSPSQGARSSLPVGSIAAPSPSMARANTSSGISASELLQPANGARTCKLTLRARELEAADHPDGIDLAAREPEAQVVRAFLDRQLRSAASGVRP